MPTDDDLPEQIKDDFAAGHYRACVEPLEVLFFRDRAPGYKGLIQLTVALMQIEMGREPRRLLDGAEKYLEEAPDGFAGLDLQRLVEEIQTVRSWLATREGPRPPVSL